MGVLCGGCAARTVLQLCWAGRGSRLLIFAGFELGVIFRRKNLLTLQLFAGVNVPGFFLLVLPACAFLPCDFRNALLRVLRLGLRSEERRVGKECRCWWAWGCCREWR